MSFASGVDSGAHEFFITKPKRAERKFKMEENKNVITCADCGVIINEGEQHYVTADGKTICESCYEDSYFTCAECGEVLSVVTANYVSDNGTYVCNNCVENSLNYAVCTDCGEVVTLEGAYELANNNVICRSCYEHGDYMRCNECEQIFEIDELICDDDGCYCQSCYSRNRRRIRNYSYKPDPVFKTIHDRFFDTFPGEELTFGTELEVDKGKNPNGLAGILADTFEDIYCKHDGSLNDGVEIVTHPCTLDYHIQMLGWDKITEMCRKWGFKSQEAGTCGLHVHVGRQNMGKTDEERNETAAKLVLLVDRHWDALVPFTRRKDYQLSEWASNSNLDHSLKYEGDIVDDALSTEANGRYQAVNLTNSETVEFRLFNGTLKYTTILATLELVSDITMYAKTHSVKECLNSQWEDIIAVNPYRELTEYLEEREIHPAKLPPREVKSGRKRKFNKGDKVRIHFTDSISRRSWLRNYDGHFAVVRGYYDQYVEIELYETGANLRPAARVDYLEDRQKRFMMLDPEHVEFAFEFGDEVEFLPNAAEEGCEALVGTTGTICYEAWEIAPNHYEVNTGNCTVIVSAESLRYIQPEDTTKHEVWAEGTELIYKGYYNAFSEDLVKVSAADRYSPEAPIKIILPDGRIRWVPIESLREPTEAEMRERVAVSA